MWTSGHHLVKMVVRCLVMRCPVIVGDIYHGATVRTGAVDRWMLMPVQAGHAWNVLRMKRAVPREGGTTQHQPDHEKHPSNGLDRPASAQRNPPGKPTRSPLATAGT